MTEQNSYHNTLKHIFTICDKNKNGTLSIDEFKSAVIQIKPSLTKEELETYFSEADKNKNGVVDFDEFELFINNYKLLSNGL